MDNRPIFYEYEYKHTNNETKNRRKINTKMIQLSSIRYNFKLFLKVNSDSEFLMWLGSLFHNDDAKNMNEPEDEVTLWFMCISELDRVL